MDVDPHGNFRRNALSLPLDEDAEVVEAYVGTDKRSVGVRINGPLGGRVWRVQRVLRFHDTGEFQLVVEDGIITQKRVRAPQEILEAVMKTAALLRLMENVLGEE